VDFRFAISDFGFVETRARQSKAAHSKSVRSQSARPKSVQDRARTTGDFPEVFSRLRAILMAHAGRFDVTANSKDHYCLTVAFSPKLKKSFPAAWVKVVKNYVGFHFMPVCMFPQLRRMISEPLRARMQGKSCFNFTTVDEALFAELEKLTQEGFALSRQAGFCPERD